MNILKKIQLPTGILTWITLIAGVWLVFNVPDDFQQGGAVKILYIHVPSAKMALLSYLVVTVASILHLWKRSETADILAEAATSVGAAFTAMTLASGSIWGKPMWGTWWAWDARLTSMLVLLILFKGLMVLRHSLDDPVKGARATAILAIIGAVDLPIIHYSVVWWRTLHQPPSLSAGSNAGIHIAGPLLTPLLILTVAFMLLTLYMTTVKARQIEARRRLDALETARMHADE
ncbi:MAG: cytochrome c biogenesis protein CcsA [Magnetococcales bacterium]|nr:cytochrome c biogenesis protein CcsA [Magnetococcales bacterium]NGZ05369.1 cytochrome c biogenesis protein CcsA [Magnetococcales bacterium]